MYLFKTGSPRKTRRNRCAKKNARHRAKNKNRKKRLQKG